MNNKVYTTPLEGQYTSKIEGVIKVKYRDDIKFNICKITYELYDDNQYQYIFEPFYDVLDALPQKMSQGIPGIDLEKRKQFYYRVNKTPSFIKERTMGEDRENLKEELDKVCMSEYNPLEWLIRTDSEYSGDNLIVERYRMPRKITKINYNDLMYGDTINDLEELDKDVYVRGNQLLLIIGSGVIIDDAELCINEKNRMGALQLLINQYDTVNKPAKEVKKDKLIWQEKSSRSGRRKDIIDDFVMEEIIKELELKIINESEAMRLMNVNTLSTLQRRIREYKKEKNN